MSDLSNDYQPTRKDIELSKNKEYKKKFQGNQIFINITEKKFKKLLTNKK